MSQKNLKTKIENFLFKSSGKLKFNSKEVKKNDVFIALKGNKFHGHNFIKDSIKNGAKYAITEIQDSRLDKNKVLYVKNSLIFLRNVSIRKRIAFKNKIIAITGSIGKTSLKETLKFFLSSHLDVSASIKSYNNYLGLLISLVNINLNSKFGIFEIGTNNFNEIKKLTKILNPHQVIITNIYPTHLKNFKNLKNIAHEKGDLFNPKYNSNLQLLILKNSNTDDKYLINLAKKNTTKNLVTWGSKKNSDFHLKNIKLINQKSSVTSINHKKELIKIKTSTNIEHQIINLLITFILFKFNTLNTNIFFNKIIKPPLVDGRGKIHRIKIKSKVINFIDESYNASPVSMLNAIKYYNDYPLKKNQKKFLILGEMLELGVKKNLYHKLIVDEVAKTNINFIFFSGKYYKKILNRKNLLLHKNIYHMSTENIMKNINYKIHNDDIILIKSSNATKLNKLAKKLINKEK